MNRRNFTKKFLAVSTAYLIFPRLAGAGGGGFGGATELTQLANNVELAGLYVQQAQAYVTQLNQWNNMLKNTLNIPNQIWGVIMQELSGVANLVKQGKALAYSASNIGEQFEATFKGFHFDKNTKYRASYENWSKTTMDSLKGALEAANFQADQFTTEESLMSQLRNMSQNAEGQMQAIQVGSQIAEQQVQQIQKLRQLMMLQLQSQNTYMASQQQRQDTLQAEKQNFYQYRDPRKGSYGSFKGGSN